jgi:chromosome partitioning protein
MGKIIGICNQKGGTGKTTTAINLSSYLSLAKKRTLLIDMDPQGNASSGTGIDVDKLDTDTVYEALIEEHFTTESILKSKWDDLNVFPSTISLTGAEIELVNMLQREKRLKRVIAQIKDQYDYIIIDAPPSLGLLTINVLAAADKIVIPIQCEYYALEGMSRLIKTVELIRKNLNASLSVEGVLLTMADFRTRLTLQVIEEVRNFFRDKAFNTIIPRNVKLAEAPSFGKPIHYYDSACVGAKAYMNLAEEIIKEPVETDLTLSRGG